MSDIKIDLTKQIVEVLENTIYPITKEKLQEYQRQENGTLNLIIDLCKQYTQNLDLAKAEIIQGKYGNKMAKVSKSNHKYTWAQLNNYGARIIYLIRSILTQEEISFLMGVTNGTNTRQVLLPQSEVLKNLEVVKKKSAIGLKVNSFSNQLAKITNNEIYKREAIERVNKWNTIYNLGTVERYNNMKKEMIEEHVIYQKDGSPDYNVYVKFSGERHMRSYYYKNSNSYIFYNLGWLWQWYNSILRGSNTELYEMVSADVDKGSIRSIILSEGKLENIAGTKMGDFQDALGNQIQSKLDNEKIISYNNIKVLLIELTKALEAWRAALNADTSQSLRETLQEHFFPAGVLIGSEAADKAFQELKQQLLSSMPKGN